MGIEIQWDNTEETVLVITYSLGWTWEDADQALQRAAQHLNRAKHIIHLITIFPPGNRLPVGSVLPRMVATYQLMTHPRLGFSLVVSESRTVRVFIDIMRRTKPVLMQRVEIFRTLDEARARVKEG